jgi:sphinganine-1-phosphate aldolase
MEDEVIGTCLSLLGGRPQSGGTFTSGGTESNFLAIKAARNRARARRRGLDRPNLVGPSSIHASAVKAAEYLGIEVRKVPYGPDFRSDVEAMARAVDDQTVLLLGSAPQFPTGVFDRIAELASLARQRELWLHVDACVGGMLSPFARKLGHPIPDFDLSVPGVTSLSADLHKYGYAGKGASVLLLADAADLEHQRFSYEWANGVYATDTVLGTRSGGAIAAAWAVMQYLGEEGYLRRAGMILDTVAAHARGIEAIPGLECIRPYDLCILLYGSCDPALDINVVAEEMGARGWYVGRAREPRDSIQIAVNPEHARAVDRYLSDLESSVANARKSARRSSFDKGTY